MEPPKQENILCIANKPTLFIWRLHWASKTAKAPKGGLVPVLFPAATTLPVAAVQSVSRPSTSSSKPDSVVPFLLHLLLLLQEDPSSSRPQPTETQPPWAKL